MKGRCHAPPGPGCCLPRRACNLLLQLATLLAEHADRLDHKILHDLIILLCAWQPLSGEQQLATLLKKDRH